ncbi:aldehyde dehydrogenase family protein [Streptomyces cacaoi]|uniref:aldehyde dehydrogenase family protein n=1 Tax=Streptomyces cacaoi TaxID=1898 RepID=UPI0037481653
MRSLIGHGQTAPAHGPAPYTSGYSADDGYAGSAAGQQEVARAVAAADQAFAAWSAVPPPERSAIFLRAAQILVLRTSQIVDTMASEVGATATWSSFNAKLAAQTLIEAAGAVTHPTGQVLPTETPGAHSMHVRLPLGVVAAIAPWNAPLILAARAVALPLALGNTVVLKASEEAPLSGGLLLHNALTEAGLPDGVLNVVTHARGDAPAVVSALAADPRVRAVNFTGSAAVGRTVAVEAARHLKPSVLELGGKNSLLIMEDADVDYAVGAAVFSAFMNAGQSCLSTDRIFVQRPLAEEFVAKLSERVTALPHSGPSWPAGTTGPLVHSRAAERVSALVSDALSKGATAVAGTGTVEAPGTLVAPVVLTDVTPDMDIWSAEIFGPVVVVHVADNADDAIALANESPCGLTAGVITSDWAAGLSIARRLRAGAVHVNNQDTADQAKAPFGGIRDSGYGRFGGQAGIEAFTDTRWITLGAEGRPAFPI